MAARCASCSSTAVTEISMTMTDGDLVDFTSCHRCEHKTWRARESADALPLDRVLALAARPKK